MQSEPNRIVFAFFQSTESTDVQYNELQSLFRLYHPNLDDFTYKPIEDMINLKPAREDEVWVGKLKQSCIVSTFIPADKIFEIIKRASYIHSCGLYIFASPMEKSSYKEIRESISQHLEKYNIKSSELSFYTKDKFGDSAGDLRELLIDQDRFFFHELQFKLARTDLMKNWPSDIKIVPTGDTSDVEARIWGYKDTAVIETEKSEFEYSEMYDEIYLILFQPKFRLVNALYKLDSLGESKPYWKGIDTTPQMLMGAMLNLAQVTDGQVVFEPFAHTGTLVLEAVKHNLSSIIYNDKFETLGAKDNIEFLTDNPEKAKETIKSVRNLFSINLKGDKDKILAVCSSSISWQEKDSYPQLISTDELSKREELLKNKISRIFFYFVRRFYIEQQIGLPYKISGLATADSVINRLFSSEAKFLIALEEYVNEKLNYLQEYMSTRDEIKDQIVQRGVTSIGYHPISTKNSKMLGQKNVDIDIVNDEIPLDDNSVDAIITDPPYGYGSRDLRNEVPLLYHRFIEEAFRLLKPGGSLVICVLDKVRTGKYANPQVKTPGVVALINKIARIRNINFITKSITPFKRDELMLSYWKAARKLNRGILTIRINK